MMNKTIYSIVGTGVHNQGAELMAHAVQIAVSMSKVPGPVIAGGGSWPAEATRRNGILPFRYFGGGLRAPLAKFSVSSNTRRNFDMYEPSEVNCVFDASGFQYSDQWGVGPSLSLQDSIEDAVRRGSRYILLPQSFGPFEDGEIRKVLKRALPSADLIYVREKTSLRFLEELIPNCRNFRLAPDFTSLVPGLPSREAIDCEGSCLIVPNARMLDKTSSDVSEGYLKHLIGFARELGSSYPIRILSHSEEDFALAKKIAVVIGLDECEVVTHKDPRIVKGIVGSAAFVIGSRYHALQAALSQGVIAFALGWSHKYPDLFDGYSWSTGILDISASVTKNLEPIYHALEVEQTTEIRKQLLEKSRQLKISSLEMWEEIFDCVTN